MDLQSILLIYEEKDIIIHKICLSSKDIFDDKNLPSDKQIKRGRNNFAQIPNPFFSYFSISCNPINFTFPNLRYICICYCNNADLIYLKLPERKSVGRYRNITVRDAKFRSRRTVFLSFSLSSYFSLINPERNLESNKAAWPRKTAATCLDCGILER